MNKPAVSTHDVSRITKLVRLEPAWVLLMGILTTFLGNAIALQYYPFLLCSLFVFWPLRRLAYGTLSRRSPVDWGIALLLISTAIGLWASTDRAMSWPAATHILFGIAPLFSALINWPLAQKNPHLLVIYLFISGTAVMLISPSITAWESGQSPVSNSPST